MSLYFAKMLTEWSHKNEKLCYEMIRETTVFSYSYTFIYTKTKKCIVFLLRKIVCFLHGSIRSVTGLNPAWLPFFLHFSISAIRFLSFFGFKTTLRTLPFILNQFSNRPTFVSFILFNATTLQIPTRITC